MKRAIVIIALAAAPVFADEVFLRGGGQITGEVISQTDDSVTVEDGSIRHDYIDVESRQNVRSEFTRTIRGVTVLLVETFSDFRGVDGLVFPHLVETNVRFQPPPRGARHRSARSEVF